MNKSRSSEEIVKELHKIREDIHYGIVFTDKARDAIGNIDQLIVYFALWAKDGTVGNKIACMKE